MELVEVESLSYWYPGRDTPALEGVNMSLRPGEFVILLGRSGSGKSTLCRALNGLVPHFHGGRMAGRVLVAGSDTLASSVRELSRTVGIVFQDPESQLVTESAGAEIAFGLENLGLERSLMAKRVAEVTATLGLDAVRRGRLSELSGGQKQKVALAAVLAMQPDVLVLDEPTSQLDPVSAEDFLATLKSLNADLGLSVLLAEHRVERCFHLADRAVVLDSGRVVFDGAPGEMASWAGERAWVPLPPVTRLFLNRNGVTPPLTVKEARAAVLTLAEKAFSAGGPGAPDPRGPGGVETGRAESKRPIRGRAPAGRGGRSLRWAGKLRKTGGETPLLELKGVWHLYANGTEALKGVDLSVFHGESVAVVGENGSGKTTLVKHFNGLLRPSRGRVLLDGFDIKGLETAALASRLGMLGQNPNLQLVSDTTEEELETTLEAVGVPGENRAALIETVLSLLELEAFRRENPADLSCGERERVALASVMVHRPDMLILDEPTRGLDQSAKQSLAGYLGEYRSLRKTVIVVTHDLEFAAGCCERVVLMGEGRILADGDRREVLADSLFFTTQYNKSFRGTLEGVITAEDAAEALEVLT